MIQSVDRALRILEYLKESPDGLGVTELALKLDVAKSSIHRLLTTLEKHHYVDKVNHGVYQLGLKFIEMNNVVIENLDIVELAHPKLKELTSYVSEITHLVIVDGFEIVYIDKVEANSMIRIYSQTGRRPPVYCTGVGKAVAAFFPEEKLERFLKETEFKCYTRQTITTEQGMIQEFKKIREVGYAIDNEEHEEGVRCVAAPVFNHRGEAQFAISVTGPLPRMNDYRLKEIAPLVKKTALEISNLISY